MTLATSGLHHVTAIGGDPQRNLDFYVRTLGVRLIKRTINFDDPGTYHLYFGDGEGRPGTLLTFFAWAGAQRGRRGAGQATTTTFSVPAASLEWWHARLQAAAQATGAIERRDGEASFTFEDPDGLLLALAGSEHDPRPGWQQPDGGTVPAADAIRGLHSTTLTVNDPAPTVALLEALGLRQVGEPAGRLRFAAGDGRPGALLDLVVDRDAPRGTVARGTVHHVAWRTPDDRTQGAWQAQLAELGANVTPVQDRQYFHSIYFREPGGTLFEIATDGPGFAIDEPKEALGSSLRLPPWFEHRRAQIEAAVAPLELPPENNPELAGRSRREA
ncbi:MAG: ring-cleaving dioxygenase [Candidatus Dormiibacterota bacterium]